MKRGQRKLWRAVAEAATKIAESKNYAQEYMGGVEFTNAMKAIAMTETEQQPATVFPSAEVVAEDWQRRRGGR